MDERYDCVRTVRDSRYIYIRNYMPHKIYGQHLAYMWETPTTRVWEKLYQEGKLNEVQSRFWKAKPYEELYDLSADPDEIENLATSPKHLKALQGLRAALRTHELKIRDIGLLPEAEIHSRGKGSSPYEAGHDPARFPAQRILDAAELASTPVPDAVSRLSKALKDNDSGVRYWAAMGAIIRGKMAVESMHDGLVAALADTAPSVRIAAAEALARFGSDDDANRSLEVLMGLSDAVKNGAYVAIQSLNAIGAVGPRAAHLKDRIRALPKSDPSAPERVRTEYISSLIGAL